MNRIKYFSFILLILVLQSCKTTKNVSTKELTGGGMWIPTEVNEAEMKQMGMKLNTQQLFNSKAPSINDAIPHFNRGCTSELISPKGLLLTNHHCGYGEIQSHSTVENDYLTDGFWAQSLSDELPNKNTTATFVIDIKEVTDLVMRGVHNNLTEIQKLTHIQENIAEIQKNTPLQKFQEVVIKPYYNGNKYYKIILETYKDVRLVGAPPSSIGKFGSDTDNWMWPRHTGDFSLFRIYADKNNQPAEYAPENIPYTPKHYLPVSIKGIKENDFTLVYGFPGRTNEYLPAAALENITQVINPSAIKIREIALGILDKKMRTDNETRIKYASKYAKISNYHKKWIGENQGLAKSNAIGKKKEYEKEFINRNKDNTTYQQLIPSLNSLYQQQREVAKTKTFYDEVVFRNSETFRVALYLSNLLTTPKDNFNNYKQRLVNYLSGLYKNYDSDLDLEVSNALLQLYANNVNPAFKPNQMVEDILNLSTHWKTSFITGNKKVNGAYITQDINTVFKDNNALISALEKDPIIQIISTIKSTYEQTAQKTYTQLQTQIEALQKTYMKAQMETFTDKKFFPDANSTLRITYGKVNGYPNEKGSIYPYQTYLEGAVAKYIPNDYEFDMSPKLLELYKTKNYGVYQDNGKMPVNFIASNHTTGGNSGSPVLDANGNLIGLNFDRVWEGTMSDLNYDPKICRNIMVDTRYILFVIDKYANAKRLINEMKLVK